MAVVIAPRRFEVWLVNLDPTQSSEIKKTRPCVVISPNELNRYLRTVTIAALTSVGRDYPSRVNYQFQGKAGQMALDHIRLVDKSQLVWKPGVLPVATAQNLCATLMALFQF